MSKRIKNIVTHFLKGIVFLLLVIFILIEIVFNFVLTPEKITPKIIQAVNKKLNAEFYADKIELGFFSTFPNFTLKIKNGSIVTLPNDSAKTFVLQDTLIRFNEGKVTVNPTAFLIEKKIDIRHIVFQQPKIYAKVNKNGEGNWDIVKTSNVKEVKQKKSDTYQANIDLDDVSIAKGQLFFEDHNTDMFLNIADLDLKSKAKYNKNGILLDLKIDTKKLKFIKENQTLINDLSVGVYGKVVVDRLENTIDLANTTIRIEDVAFIGKGKLIPNKEKKELGVQLEIALKTPSISSIIQLIPEKILKRKNDFTSTGKVSLNGSMNGIYGNGKIPVIQANLQIKKGQLAYNNKPKKIDLIETNMLLFIDPSKKTPSHIEISDLNIKGDQIHVHLNGNIEDIYGNTKVNALFKGTVDLNSVSQTFPLNDQIKMDGKLESNLETLFYLDDISKKDMTKVLAKGTLSMQNVKYTYGKDSIIFETKSSKAAFLKDKNNQEFTLAKSNVMGGRIDLSKIKLTVKNKIDLNADKFLLEYDVAKMKNSTQITQIRSKLNIENFNFNLKDSIKGTIVRSNAKITQKPSIENNKIAAVHSNFDIDSVSIHINNRFFAITDGNYNLDLIKNNDKKWSAAGEILFTKMFAYTPEFPLMLKMPKTKMTITPEAIELNKAKVKLGKSDLTVTGKIIDFNKTLFENKNLIMKMAVKSNLIDVNELIETLNKATNSTINDIDFQAQASKSTDTLGITKPKSFVIPKKIDFEFDSNITTVLYKDQILEDTKGLITIKNQKVDLLNLQMHIKKAQMTAKIELATKEETPPSLAFDFNLNNINLKALINFLPVLDSLLPMSKSFEGDVKFRIRGTTKLNNEINMVATSLAAISRIEGKNMVVMGGETFSKIAKKLWFKDKEKNIIDEISVEILIKDNVVEVLPAQVFIDRYRIAVGGIYNLNLTYNYQFSILKSPLPFKAGIDMIGDENDYKLKLTRAKYKRIFSKKKKHLKKADSILVKKKMEIINRLPF